MAMRLSKAQARQQRELAESLKAAGQAVERHFVALLKELPAIVGPVNEAIQRYNAALAEARAFAHGFSEECRDAFDEKSERWQEGDAGQAANDFITEWEEFDPFPLPEIAIVEPELEEPPCQVAKALSELPEESQQ